VLLAGEPGVGKSTLLLEVAAKAAGTGTVLYVTGEESSGQVRLRAERTGAVHDGLYLAAESDLSAVVAHIDAVAPRLLVVDSVQTMSTDTADGAPGGVTQVRAVTVALTGLAKERGLPVVLVGHVTKDGSIAGPRVLEHLVDVVLSFEGDKHSTLRMVRGVKNRFGPADEVGCFELRDEGIVGWPDPSGLFLARFGGPPVPGTAVTVVMDGRARCRPSCRRWWPARTSQPAPAVSGLDNSRVAMLLAVLERRAGVRLHDAEVYAATVGGMRITNRPRPRSGNGDHLGTPGRRAALGSGVLGEIGLAGETPPGGRGRATARRGRAPGVHPRDGPARTAAVKRRRTFGCRRSATWALVLGQPALEVCLRDLVARWRPDPRTGVHGSDRGDGRTGRRHDTLTRAGNHDGLSLGRRPYRGGIMPSQGWQNGVGG
jgi:DNA repair protein RadA/Sms